MRNAEKHHGMPMIVIAMISAARTQATAAKRPPKISHRILSRKFSGDIGCDLLPIDGRGQYYAERARFPGATGRSSCVLRLLASLALRMRKFFCMPFATFASS